MSLIYTNEHEYVKYGGRLDSCMFCAMDLSKEKKISYNEALIKTRGELEGRKVIKFKKSGSDVVICKKHISEMNKLLQSDNKKNSKNKEKVEK